MSGAAGSGAGAAGSVGSVVRRFLAEYGSGTPSRLKVLDAYLLYVLLTGALQFGYCLGVGTFPFNSFLSGFISAVGSFILGGQCPATPAPAPRGSPWNPLRSRALSVAQPEPPSATAEPPATPRGPRPSESCLRNTQISCSNQGIPLAATGVPQQPQGVIHSSPQTYPASQGVPMVTSNTPLSPITPSSAPRNPQAPAPACPAATVNLRGSCLYAPQSLAPYQPQGVLASPWQSRSPPFYHLVLVSFFSNRPMVKPRL